MNLRFLILPCAAPVCLLAGDPEHGKTNVAQKSLDLVKKTFPYQLPVAQATGEPEASDADKVVQMTPFVVDESHLMIELDRQMEREAQKLKAERFTFTKGGLFYKNERVEIGASKHRDLFGDDAKFKAPNATLELDLLRLKW